MRVLNNEPLAPYTTLGLGGPARHLLELETEADLVSAVGETDAKQLPFSLLGGGSNVVVADDGIDHALLRVQIRGLHSSDQGDTVQWTIGAGESWDEVVAQSVDSGLVGLECLSGIPGLAGAAPIQNIGAYGQDLSGSLVAVRAFDRVKQQIVELPASSCQLGYRDSLFKRPEMSRRFVVAAITLRLRRGNPASIAYPELRRTLELRQAQPSATQIRSAVLELRRSKGMVYDRSDPDSRSAGSFFVNPVTSRARAAALQARARELGLLGPDQPLPRFPAGPDASKIPAAWLVEHSGFRRGERRGGAAISSKHALALVNADDATARDVLELAHEITTAVRQRFGLALLPEPVFLGFQPDPTGLHGRLPPTPGCP